MSLKKTAALCLLPLLAAATPNPDSETVYRAQAYSGQTTASRNYRPSAYQAAQPPLAARPASGGAAPDSFWSRLTGRRYNANARLDQPLTLEAEPFVARRPIQPAAQAPATPADSRAFEPQARPPADAAYLPSERPRARDPLLQPRQGIKEPE